MNSIGSIAANFHEGTRSEYLAQYFFSAFGTSIPVPHPEDSGIDLYCTLGERIGQRFHVQNYYFVQIKSEKTEIKYDGEESVKWLLSHRYPILICFVDKQSQRIKVFQTVPVTMCFAKAGINSITLIPDGDKDFSKNTQGEHDLRIYLGPPILDFGQSEMQHDDWTKRGKQVLKSWIELDQENINRKPFGLAMFTVPKSYETNQPLDLDLKHFKLNGNFKEPSSSEHRGKYDDLFFLLLSQYVHQVAAEKDIRKFKVIADFAGQFLESQQLKYSLGLWSLVVAVNTGAEYVGFPARIKLTGDGKQETPRLKIQNAKKGDSGQHL